MDNTNNPQKDFEQKNMGIILLERILNILAYIAGAVLLLMAVLLTLNALLRKTSELNQFIPFTIHPIKGAEELIQFMLITLVFFSLAYTEKLDGHVKVDFIINTLAKRISKKVPQIINVINKSVSIVIFVLMGIMGCIRANNLIKIGMVSTDLSIPIFPFVFIVALGCFAMALRIILDLIKERGKF